MNRPVPPLRGLILSGRQLKGLRAALLEAITSETLVTDELSLARHLREGLGELQDAVRAAGHPDTLGVLLPTEYCRVAALAVERVLTTLLPFETTIRVSLDPAELETLRLILGVAGDELSCQLIRFQLPLTSPDTAPRDCEWPRSAGAPARSSMANVSSGERSRAPRLLRAQDRDLLSLTTDRGPIPGPA